MKFVDLIEGMTDILYHYRNFPTALEVMRNDRFILTSAMKADAEELLGTPKLYFFSSTRSNQGDYHQHVSDGVLFVIDGRKMGHKYTAKPVDYWGRDINKPEFEDRIFSDTPYIPASPYIISMHVLFVARPTDVEFELKKRAEEKNIPIYLYNDKKAWLLQDKRKALDIKVPDEFEYPKQFKSRVFGKDRGFPKKFTFYKSLLDGVDEKELSHRQAEILRHILALQKPEDYEKDMYLNTALRTLRMEISRHSGRDVGQTQRDYGDKFLQHLRKLNIRSTVQLVAKIKEIYASKSNKKPDRLDQLDITQEYIDEIDYTFNVIFNDFYDRHANAGENSSGLKSYYHVGYIGNQTISVHVKFEQRVNVDHLILMDHKSFLTTYPRLPLIFNMGLLEQLEQSGGTDNELTGIIRDDLNEILNELKSEIW